MTKMLKKRQTGFTLVEMIVVITITAIIGAVVAVFIRAPVQGYVDASRRATLTDIADTALRRIGRDLRLALPNSVRVTNAGQTVEFLLTSTGGRYRSEPKNDGTGDVLDFAATDSSFDVIGPKVNLSLSDDEIAVYNLGPNVSGANAYNGDNIAPIAGASAVPQSNVTLASPGFQFPFSSPANRFQVVETPVSYVCDLTTGTLWRYWHYPIQATQPTAAQLPGLAGVLSARLATNVSSCNIDYSPGVTQRSGLVSMLLQISQSGETVTLYDEVHVTNVP